MRKNLVGRGLLSNVFGILYTKQGADMTLADDPQRLSFVIRETILSMVRDDGDDLTARQLSVLLTVYLKDGPHTVRGLAAELSVSKTAITRALDRLGELSLARRAIDPNDRRSVNVERTAAGNAYLRNLGNAMTAALRSSETQVSATAAA
jgi:DNA-binding MarR family transcriptional regulator